VLGECLAILLLVFSLVIHVVFLAVVRHRNHTVLLLLGLTVLKSKFINNDSLTLVGKARALAIDVFVVAMADDSATGQLDFACWQQLSLLDIQVIESFSSCLALALPVHHVLEGGGVRA